MKFKLLAPIAVVIVLLIFVSIFGLYFVQKTNDDDRLKENINETELVFQNFISSQTNILNLHIGYLLKDPVIQRLLKEKNRDKLYEYCLPLFLKMKEDFKITQFYFIDKNDTGFLRIHNKSLFGNKVDRYTYQQSKQTQKLFSGIELNGIGKLALRSVCPLEINHEIQYYIELAMEIDPDVPFLKKALKSDLIFTINKKYLSKTSWENGLKRDGKKSNWNEYPDFVIARKTFDRPIDLKNIVNNRTNLITPFNSSGENFEAGIVPLTDAAHQKIGDIIVIINTNKEDVYMEAWIMRLLFIGVLSGFILLGFFYKYISKIENRITTSHKKLEKSEHDLHIQNENLKIALEKAEESDRLQSAFLGNMSHEIRTPMNAIIGFSELLESDQPEERKKQFTGLIRQRTLELNGILDNILHLSRLEARSMDYNPMKGSVEDVFQKVYSHFVHECKYIYKKNIEIRYINDSPDFSFYTDFSLLKRILDNLVSNACKFTETGFVEFGCKKNDAETVLLWVKDTGIGISKEDIPIIFSRFRQADGSATRKFGGNGIGLTISKACAELLGGKIWVESELGKGSVFYFTVPMDKL